ncbi:MAG: hypothetical protein KBD06_02730 [Candidatus Pacebacteria bacterium]|nr:hypothetical protein [Candidatus Paceibacterota bacterium]
MAKIGLDHEQSGRVLFQVAALASGGGYDTRITPVVIARSAFRFVVYSDDMDRCEEFMRAQTFSGHHLAMSCCRDVIYAVVQHGCCRKYPFGVEAFDFSLALREAMRHWAGDHSDAFYEAFRQVNNDYQTALGFPPQKVARTGTDD